MHAAMECNDLYAAVITYLVSRSPHDHIRAVRNSESAVITDGLAHFAQNCFPASLSS